VGYDGNGGGTGCCRLRFENELTKSEGGAGDMACGFTASGGGGGGGGEEALDSRFCTSIWATRLSRSVVRLVTKPLA
jgi:hypothetical protein